MSLRITVDLKGAAKFRQGIRQAIQQQGSDRLELMNNIGLTVLRWVDQNFASGGGLVGGWAPLKASTIFGRRQGSSVPLANTGMLRSGFTYKATETEAVIGTANRIAAYHQFGTHPYIIRPKKPGGVLAFLSPPMSNVATKRTRTSLRRRRAGSPNVGLVPTSAARVGGLSIPGGKGGLQSFLFTKIVHHPGLPARRMLPRAGEILSEIKRTAADWLQHRLGRSGIVVKPS